MPVVSPKAKSGWSVSTFPMRLRSKTWACWVAPKFPKADVMGLNLGNSSVTLGLKENAANCGDTRP